jgi:branched-chain amino acid aminotransferase
MSTLWINGALIDKADAKVSPFDHGFLYGDGVWEHLRVFGGKLFRPDDHLRLLFSAAETLGIDIPLSRDKLLAAIDATVKANARTEGYVRVIVTRGPGTIGPDPRKLDPQVIVIAEEYKPFPAELYGHGLHAVVAGYPYDIEDDDIQLRVLGRPVVAQAKRHAVLNGCLEAVMATSEAVVAATEGTIFRLQEGRLTWAEELAPADPAADAVAELAADQGRSVGREWITLSEAMQSEELFIAGTTCGVIGIVKLGGRVIGAGSEGPVTRAIRERFRVLTRGGVG